MINNTRSNIQAAPSITFNLEMEAFDQLPLILRQTLRESINNLSAFMLLRNGLNLGTPPSILREMILTANQREIESRKIYE